MQISDIKKVSVILIYAKEQNRNMNSLHHILVVCNLWLLLAFS